MAEMKKIIRTPATSANLGPGFDCLGLAWNIYNTFEVSLSSCDELAGVEDKYNNEDNLFLRAFHMGMESLSPGGQEHVRAVFSCEIPTSRGLGSSASLIVAGLLAASGLSPSDHRLSEEQLLQLSSKMEGHPDNAAPCLMGGLTAACQTGDGRYIARQLDLSPSWQYTLLIPDFEVSTEKARKILPDAYPRQTAAANAAHAVLMTKALAEGDLELLKVAAVDELHEPYRRTLITGYDRARQMAEEDTGGVLLISGSGSTMLVIGERTLSQAAEEEIQREEAGWKILRPRPAARGEEAEDEH